MDDICTITLTNSCNMKHFCSSIVGVYSFELIKLLTTPPFSVNASSIHIIGSSLGGQVAAHLGHHARGGLGRITGLDPSGPLFHSAPPSKRLDKSDAQVGNIKEKLCGPFMVHLFG